MPVPLLAPVAARVGLAVQLDGLAFNQGAIDENGVEHYLSDLEGWDSPSLRADLDDRPLAHGAFRGTSFYGVREIGLKGTLVSPHGIEALRIAKDRLAQACDLTDVDGVLTVAETPAKRALVRRAGRLRYAQVGRHLLRWELDLTAADPRKYASAERSITLLAGQSAEAVNLGRFRGGAPLRATFVGPLTAPVLGTAGGNISLSSLAAGEGITVDTLEGTVLSGTATAYSRLTSNASLPMLPPNSSSSVALSATAGTGSVTVTWRDTWI